MWTATPRERRRRYGSPNHRSGCSPRWWDPGARATIDRIRNDPKSAVALTGYASAEDAKKAYDAGFSVHVAKPFDMLDLCDIVARLSPARPRNAGPSG